MRNLYSLSDQQMARLRPYFPRSHGKPRVYDQRVFSGIVFVDCNGLRWRDAPSAHAKRWEWALRLFGSQAPGTCQI